MSTYDPLANALTVGLSAFRSNPPMRASEWMDKYYVLSSDAVSVRWECLPYQRAMIDAMGNDDIRIVTIQKSARVGYTQSLCGIISYNIHHRRRNQIIYQPKDKVAQGFCKESIDPMISNIPEIGALLASGDKKGKGNTLDFKQFIGARLHILGGNSKSNFDRITADATYYDELDRFDPNIGGAGSPTFLGDKRFNTSSFPKSIRGSTPGEDAGSMIAESLSSAQQVFYRFLPCYRCGTFFHLVWKNLIWKNRDPSTAVFVCEHCTGEIQYQEYAEMDRAGEWRTLPRSESDSGFCVTDGVKFVNQDLEPMPAPRHIGFFIWGAYSYFQTWNDIAHEFLEARAAQKRGARSPMISFTNLVRGEPSKTPGDRHEWEEIRARAEPYKLMVVPKGAVLLTAGVDCQDDRLPFVVRAWAPDKESWLVYRGELIGDPIEPAVWKKLDLLLFRDWETEEGGVMKISCMAIDTGGHRTQAVYNYCRSRWPVVIAIKGSTDKTSPMLGSKPSVVEVKWSGNVYKRGVRLWRLGVEKIKDDLAARLNLKEPAPGYMHFPMDQDDEYYKQLCGDVRETRTVKGKQVTDWVQSRSSIDAWDAEQYCYAAAIREGIELMAKAHEKPPTIPHATPSTVPVVQKAVRPPRLATSWLEPGRGTLKNWLTR